MLLAVEAENMLEHIISSYETRIQTVENLFETTHQIFQGLGDSVLDAKQERQKISEQLRDSLAQNESLRRKDFDNMMSVISSDQDQKEQEVRTLSKTYLTEQTYLAQELRKSLRGFTDALAKGEAQRVQEFQGLIKGILAEQEKRKEDIISKLNEFQREQQEMAKRLKNLLARGRELRVKDLKLMLAEFKRQRKERLTRQAERRQEVKDMLSKSKSKRATASGRKVAGQQRN